MTSTGHIEAIVGPVVDVKFPVGETPNVNHALTVEGEDHVLEVQQQLGDHVVRTIELQWHELAPPIKMVQFASVTTPAGSPDEGACSHLFGHDGPHIGVRVGACGCAAARESDETGRRSRSCLASLLQAWSGGSCHCSTLCVGSVA